MNPLRRRIQTAMQQGGGAAAWTPASIAGLKVWLDMTDAASVTVATGASQINDLSGNGNHATQATGSKQPVYTSGDYITFDGVDDWMEIPALGELGTNSRSYVVQGYWSSASDFYLVNFYNNDVGFSGLMATVTAGKPSAIFINTSAGISTAQHSAALLSQFVSFVVTRSATTLKLYVNGTFITSADISGSNNVTKNLKTFLGGLQQAGSEPDGFFFNGRMRKVLIYTSELTAADVTNLYNAGY